MKLPSYILEFENACSMFLDTKECTMGTHNCHEKATCTNADGSFSCTCSSGYHGNGVICTGRLNVLVITCFYAQGPRNGLKVGGGLNGERS